MLTAIRQAKRAFTSLVIFDPPLRHLKVGADHKIDEDCEMVTVKFGTAILTCLRGDNPVRRLGRSRAHHMTDNRISFSADETAGSIVKLLWLNEEKRFSSYSERRWQHHPSC